MFRFTIRDLLWLMVVVGMGCVWLLDRRHLSAELAAMRRPAAQLAAQQSSSSPPAVALRQSHDIIHFSIIGRTISSEFAEEQKESFGRRAESRIAEPLGRLLRLGKLLLDRPSANKLLADCVFRMALGNSR
jgi:hypothetical protein